MFVHRFTFGFKKAKRVKPYRSDVVLEQVRKILTDTDQKLILMVRG